MKPIQDKFVLLFSPQPVESGRRVAPLGLIAISSFLIKENYDIRIFHSYDKNYYLEAIEHLDKAICVGITSMTGYQIYDGLQFAKLVREKNPKVPIIWGGIHPTIMPAQTAEHPLVDIVVKGPGEDTFTELVKCIDEKKSYDTILGITFKKNGKIIDNPPRPVKGIDEYPRMPYSVLGESVESYIKKNAYAKRNLAYITSSGCPFRCAFCYLANTTFSRKWDSYPAQRVVNEIEYLVNTFYVDGIEIRDSNFFVDPSRVNDFCNLIIKKELKVVFSSVNGRADQLNKYSDDAWELFRKAGIREILIGAESGDQEMLDLINKKSAVEEIITCEKKAKSHGIDIINSFMTSFPPQSQDKKEIRKVLKRELDKTVDVINTIFTINPVANILLFFYTPYPGTPLFDSSVQNGFREPSNLEEWSKIDLSNKVTPWTHKTHVKKVLLLQKLFIIRRATSKELVNKRRGWKHTILKRTCVYSMVHRWVTFRMKHKWYFFSFENYLFSLSKYFK